MPYSLPCIYLQQPYTRPSDPVLARCVADTNGAYLSTPYENILRKIRPIPHAKPLILCIEDDPIYLTLRKAVLEQNGHNVIGVTTAADALKVLREAPVCATVADHMLHGTTGTQLAKEMKKIKPDVPVILFSGTVPRKLNGVDVYVNKGEPTAEFLRILGEVVQRYRF